MGLTNLGRDLGRFSLQSTSQKLSTLSGTPPFSINLFLLTSLLVLLVGLTLFFLTGVLAWFIKITKVTPFKSVKAFCKNPFLALYFSLFSSMISVAASIAFPICHKFEPGFFCLSHSLCLLCFNVALFSVVSRSPRPLLIDFR